jgi:hypothetical protein
MVSFFERLVDETEVDPIIRTTGGPALDSGRRSFSTPWAIDFPRCLIT